MARKSLGIRSQNFWPGFVDALAALLLVTIFLLVVFVLAQIFLSEALSGKDKALEKLNSQVLELTSLLSLEKESNEELKLKILDLDKTLNETINEKNKISNNFSNIKIEIEKIKNETANKDKIIKENLIVLEQAKSDLKNLMSVNKGLERSLSKSNASLTISKEKINEINKALTETRIVISKFKIKQTDLESSLLAESNKNALSQAKLTEKNVELNSIKKLYESAKNEIQATKNESNKNLNVINNLNIQIAALRAQLEALQSTLEKAEEKDKKQKVVISDLGKKLNKALAQKVQELSKYRSEFFGKLREVIGNRNDILIVGDRFVLQSEVLFSSGSAELEEEGKAKLLEVAKTLLEIMPSIPSEINWILRVDGHTDTRPINNYNFASNWELSTARASNVVKYLIKAGIPAKNIAATGFASFQPLDSGNDEISYRRNRRIEFKLTEK